MSNAYSFDFLRSEHTLTDDGKPKADTSGPTTTSSSSAQALLLNNQETEEQLRQLAARVAHKPDLEKQFDVIHFLQAHRSAGCLPPNVIYRATGIDLEETDESVAEMLQRNPKIRVEKIPDPENPSVQIATYAYQAKYNNVRDPKTLLAQINRCKNGVPMRDLMDAYDGVEGDLQQLITAGDVLAINNSEDKDKILFPRGEAFLVELDGLVTLKKIKKKKKSKQDTAAAAAAAAANADNATSSGANTTAADGGAPAAAASSSSTTTTTTTEIYVVETDVDPRKQIRRGEAINVAGQWFRVSSAVKEGVPLSEQPVRAQAPLSVVSLQELSKRNEQDGYIRPLNQQLIPLDAPLTQASVQNLKESKAARDKLHKLAHNTMGARSGMTTAAQLLSSNAHASNPTTLAQSFALANQPGGGGGFGAGGAGGPGAGGFGSSGRKRPTKISAAGSDNIGGTGGDGNAMTARMSAAKRKEAVEAQQKAASNPALAQYSHARRHGCTKDVREMYLALNNKQTIPESETELQALLVKHGLLDPEEKMRRPRLAKRSNVDNDGKPKKRRYYERKNQRMTNTHLEGTEIGAVLRRAQETQRQGKSVGDGGM